MYRKLIEASKRKANVPGTKTPKRANKKIRTKNKIKPTRFCAEMRRNDCSCTQYTYHFLFFSPHPIYRFRPSTPAPSLPGNNYSTSGIYNAAVVRSSDPGPQSRLFSPVPTDMLYHVRCVPCVFSTRRVEHFLPSTTRVESCIHPTMPGALPAIIVKFCARKKCPLPGFELTRSTLVHHLL